MLSTITNHENDQLPNQLLEYESIFKHYGFGNREYSSNIEMNDGLKRDRKSTLFDRNESNKKTINAKSVSNKAKQKPRTISKKSKISDKKGKKKNQHKSIKLSDAAKTRKTTYSGSKNQQSPKVASPVPTISVHAPSNTTLKTIKNLPTSDSNVQLSTVSRKGTGEPNAIQMNRKGLPTTVEPSNDDEFMWDLNEINKFTQYMFQYNYHDTKHFGRSDRVRLKCPIDEDDHLERYLQSRSQCMDAFEEYINGLKRQHGLIRPAASDPAVFEPGLIVMGPLIRKDFSIIDKEDAQAINKMMSIEPRKKYALAHEVMGVFIIGGYNLYVDIPEQKEPKSDYLFKYNGSVEKISPLRPCRINFAAFTDGEAIYVVGGQRLDNTLLDDIQRFNLKTFKWEHVATLMNPIAACGMTMDNGRIYLAGGYDIMQNQTIFLADYTIYNVATQTYEKSTDLPTPRCRSLVFATDHAIYCVSGLVHSRDYDTKGKMIISRDVLQWAPNKTKWVKVSETPELTKYHALAYNNPYLEVTKRILNLNGDEVDLRTQAYFDFRTHTWSDSKSPAATKSVPPTNTDPSPAKTPSKTKSSSKTPSKKKKSSKNKPQSKPSSKSKTSSKNKRSTKKTK